jgi:hypothetical protein
MEGSEVGMSGTPERVTSSIITPDTVPYDDDAEMADMDEVEMGTPQGATPSVGTGTEPFGDETPMDYAYLKGHPDYKYAYINGKLHMIKMSYFEGLSKSDKIEIIFNMIKKSPERYKNLIEVAMRVEFDTTGEYVIYVTDERFKTHVSTPTHQTLQGIVDYHGFVKSFFECLPGAGETDVSLNERIKSEIDEDREIIDLKPDTSAARSLFAGARPSKKSSKKKRSKKKKKKSKGKRNSKGSKRKSFKRYRRK